MALGPAQRKEDAKVKDVMIGFIFGVSLIVAVLMFPALNTLSKMEIQIRSIQQSLDSIKSVEKP